MVKLGSIDIMHKLFYLSFFRVFFLSTVDCHGCPILFFCHFSVTFYCAIHFFMCPNGCTRYTRTNDGTFIHAINARLTNDIALFWTIVCRQSLISWVYSNL